MAAPPTADLNNLDGVWAMNKKLSDPFDDVLALQGIGWLLRKAIGLASVTLYIKQRRDEEGIEHIDIEQVITGGIKTTPEHRAYEDKWGSEHNDAIFGKVRGRNRRYKISDLKDDDPDEAFLKKGWTQDVVDANELIDGLVESLENGWTARLVWGFEDIDGERRHTRRSVVRKGDQVKMIKIVYDYKGPLPPPS